MQDDGNHLFPVTRKIPLAGIIAEIPTEPLVYWKTLYLEPAFAEINREGIATPADVIKHITPLGWQHISLTGDYIWTPTDSLDLRPLRRETSMLAA